MEKITKLFILAFALTFYLLIFNFLVSLDFSQINLSSNADDLSQQSTTEEASFGDSVEVTNFHDGWLWNIQSFHYADHKDSTVYLLGDYCPRREELWICKGSIPLPWIIQDFNIFYLHFVVGILSFIIFLGIMFSTERGYYG